METIKLRFTMKVQFIHKQCFACISFMDCFLIYTYIVLTDMPNSNSNRSLGKVINPFVLLPKLWVKQQETIGNQSMTWKTTKFKSEEDFLEISQNTVYHFFATSCSERCNWWFSSKNSTLRPPYVKIVNTQFQIDVFVWLLFQYF